VGKLLIEMTDEEWEEACAAVILPADRFSLEVLPAIVRPRPVEWEDLPISSLRKVDGRRLSYRRRQGLDLARIRRLKDLEVAVASWRWGGEIPDGLDHFDMAALGSLLRRFRDGAEPSPRPRVRPGSGPRRFDLLGQSFFPWGEARRSG
jgi:hypothetical protein